MPSTFGPSAVCFILATILFAIAAFGFPTGRYSVSALGLVFLALGHVLV